jgi:tocopherol cyclase
MLGDASFTGRVLLNGRELNFTGGKGYIEGDSGRSFPKSYTWVQCNDFTVECSIMVSVVHIPFASYEHVI